MCASGYLRGTIQRVVRALLGITSFLYVDSRVQNVPHSYLHRGLCFLCIQHHTWHPICLGHSQDMYHIGMRYTAFSSHLRCLSSDLETFIRVPADSGEKLLNLGFSCGHVGYISFRYTTEIRTVDCIILCLQVFMQVCTHLMMILLMLEVDVRYCWVVTGAHTCMHA